MLAVPPQDVGSVGMTDTPAGNSWALIDMRGCGRMETELPAHGRAVDAPFTNER